MEPLGGGRFSNAGQWVWQAFLGEKGPEKVVGVIRTCLARDFSNFVDAYPASLRGPRGSRALTLPWQDLKSCFIASSFSGWDQLGLPEEPFVVPGSAFWGHMHLTTICRQS